MTDWTQLAGQRFTPGEFAALVRNISRDSWSPHFVVWREASSTHRSHGHPVKHGSLRVLVTEDAVLVLSVPQEGSKTADLEVEVTGEFDKEPGATRVRTNVKAILKALDLDSISISL